MPRTSWKDIAAYPIPIPPMELANTFNEMTKPMISRIIHNIHQAQILTDLRDTLLPRLISGKLRLPEAEADDDLADPFQRDRDTGRTIDLSDL